jgi:hypothetical protein
METWFETVFGLQRDGKVDPKYGLPNLLQLALIAREYEFYLARPHCSCKGFSLGCSPHRQAARVQGYPEYSGEEEPLGGREGERPSAASGPMRGAL